MTSLKIFNSIQDPIKLIPDLILNFKKVSISMKRIEKYLFQDEINPRNAIKKDKYMTNNNLRIKIVDGNYSWGILPPSSAVLKKQGLKDNNIENAIKKENPKNESRIPFNQLNKESIKKKS